MAKKKKQTQRVKPVPEEKKKLVSDISEKVKNSRTILIASTKGLPASQFQKIKKKLRGKVDVVVAKKSIILRALASSEKGNLQNLKEQIVADTVLMFSEIESFELAALLAENQTPTKARVGDIAPEDINVEAGPTDLLPGPAISELGAVGLKVSVEAGKLAIKQGITLVKKGDTINDKAANVLSKLNITPMKVGFIPLAAYDAKSDSIYTEIHIDKEGALNELRNAIGKALGFAVNIKYVAKETLSYFISKAAMEEKAIERLFEKSLSNNGKEEN